MPGELTSPRAFLIDENLPGEIAARLRTQGDLAEHVYEAGLRGAPDAEIFQYAQKRSQVIVTADLGLGNILRYPSPHSGIVVVRLPDSLPITIGNPVQHIRCRPRQTYPPLRLVEGACPPRPVRDVSWA